MTSPLIRIVLALLLSTPLFAEVATRATAILTAPAADAAVLKLVKTGEPLPDAAVAAPAPAGWTAVSVAGPHEVYVENKFINKELEIKPGSPLHAAPKAEAAVLATSSEGDDIEITGLRGRWTQLRLNKSIVGFVQGSAASPAKATAPIVATAPLQDMTPSATTGASRPVPAAQPGRQVNRSEAERTSLAALPRLFEGKLTSTRSPLRPRRPYDFALETDDGTRFAYLDLAKLLLTEQIENYLDHTVVVYGVARPVPETKDIVITVESLQSR